MDFGKIPRLLNRDEIAARGDKSKHRSFLLFKYRFEVLKESLPRTKVMTKIANVVATTCYRGENPAVSDNNSILYLFWMKFWNAFENVFPYCWNIGVSLLLMLLYSTACMLFLTKGPVFHIVVAWAFHCVAWFCSQQLEKLGCS